MKTILGIFLFLLFSSCLSAQSDNNRFISKHASDREKYSETDFDVNFPSSQNTIIPIRENIKSTPSTTVFGYLPYWEYPSALEYLQYDLLSHIAIFDFDVLANGNLENPPNWPWTDLINTSHENGVKIIITAVNFTGSQIHDILNNDVIKNNLFSNLLSVLQNYSLDGVNIDFEDVDYSDRGEIMNEFMHDLTNYLLSHDSTYEVSFAAPPVNWGGWDFEGLAESCDYLFIMGYNFWGPWSSTSGPCAPLVGGAYNITSVLLEEYEPTVLNNPEKLILGIPYYGNKWNTQNTLAYSNVLDHISQPTYRIAMNLADQDTLIWDSHSETSWSIYENNNTYYQTWFDNDSSVGLKYSLAEDYQLKGVGMWALGYDGDRLELWDELRRHYGEPVSTNNLMEKTSTVLNIFPNPTNRYAKIKINQPLGDDFSIEIIDLHGRLISTITQNQTDKNGNITLNIDMHELNQGIYLCIYRYWLNSSQTIITEKIILQ